MRSPALKNTFQYKKMDTNTKGLLTELNVASYVIKKGYSVSVPYGDKDRYDQIWDINGTLLKIQIKTSHWLNDKQEAFEFKTESGYMKAHKNITRTYTKNEIDYFATFFENRCYVVPVEECGATKILRFSSNAKNQTTINWAKNYTFEEIIEK